MRNTVLLIISWIAAFMLGGLVTVGVKHPDWFRPVDAAMVGVESIEAISGTSQLYEVTTVTYEKSVNQWCVTSQFIGRDGVIHKNNECQQNLYDATAIVRERSREWRDRERGENETPRN